MRRALALGCVAVALGALALAVATSGCAEPQAPAPNPRSARDYEPDGGWASYRPSWQSAQTPTSDPGPLSAPIMPVIPGSGSVSPTVH